MMTSPVLVTGGTGRLGRHVVARLVDAGCEVRVLARHQRETQPQVRFYVGDLRKGARHRSGRHRGRGDRPLRDQLEGRRGRD